MATPLPEVSTAHPKRRKERKCSEDVPHCLGSPLQKAAVCHDSFSGRGVVASWVGSLGTGPRVQHHVSSQKTTRDVQTSGPLDPECQRAVLISRKFFQAVSSDRPPWATN